MILYYAPFISRTMQYLMPYLFFSLFLFFVCFSSHAFDEIEHKSLLSLPFNTSSPPLNWSSIDYCHWEGISCNQESKVTHIWLPYKGLKGSLSTALGNLTYLSHLNVSHNLLFGFLPKELLSSLTQLKVLDLGYNNLFGDIRDTSGWSDSIQVLDISSNHFSGIIPSLFLQRSWRLISINVSNNSFIGPIPSFPCSNSSFVKVLDLSYNDHNGKIPWGLGACSKLEVFRAGANSLSGPLPDDIYNAKQLEEISLPFNDLSGYISNDIVNLTKLINLELSYNKLSGKLPRNIGKLSKLRYLLMDSNLVTGPLPSSLVNCTSLRKLMLQENFLEGNISTFNFSSLHQLTIINLGVNSFCGNLPVSLYSCKSLIAIRLSINGFEGQIGPEVLQLKFLSFLSLAFNRLTNITGAIRILAHCKCLNVLLLGGNFLHEAMPNDGSIGSNIFESIRFLDLSKGQLTGQLPKWISFLKKLEILCLDNNYMTGSIPSWLATLPRLFRLDLSSNLISGGFPKELCTMPALVQETLEEFNYLSLPIFIVLPGRQASFARQIKSLPNFQPLIDISNNHLSGGIPIEIGLLKQLHALDLSHNNFSGNIPDQIAELTNLEELDLSTNQMSGEIPESLATLHFLSYFNVSYNHLHGRIPSSTQLQSFDATAYKGNLELCGPPLPRCANNVENKRDKYVLYEDEKLGMPWFLVCVVLGFLTGFWGVCGLLLFNYKLRVAYFRFLYSLRDWFYVTVGVLLNRLCKRY